MTFAASNRGYGMPNRMTRMIAGVDPVCTLSPASERSRLLGNDAAMLEQAMVNLRDRFMWVGVLERLSEMGPLLPSRPTLDVVRPRLASQGGEFQLDRAELERILGPYVELDTQLYAYANDLLTSSLAKVAANTKTVAEPPRQTTL